MSGNQTKSSETTSSSSSSSSNNNMRREAFTDVVKQKIYHMMTLLNQQLDIVENMEKYAMIR